VAAFSTDGSDFQRLDWLLLQNGAVTLYFRREALDLDAGWLRAHGYQVRELDCINWSEVRAMHQSVAKALSFPDYYGMNLDALNDCLSDVEIPADAGLAIVLQRIDVFASRHRDVAQRMLDIFADNARRFLLFGRRLLVLAQSDDPRISFEPVGAKTVQWNPKEWLDASRGL
jgi:RNAse (barnase) inhibitor barstar